MKFKFFCDDQNGTTAVEYALIAGAIGVALMGFFFSWGDAITNIFTSLAEAI